MTTLAAARAVERITGALKQRHLQTIPAAIARFMQANSFLATSIGRWAAHQLFRVAASFAPPPLQAGERK